MTEPRYIREAVVTRFLRRKGREVSCCSSCHEEVAEGFGDLCELLISRNRVIRVCCNVAEVWRELEMQYQWDNMKRLEKENQ